MSGDSPAEIEAEAQAFVAEYWDPTITVREWWSRMAEHRFSGTTLPVEAGGRGWSRAQATAANRVFLEHKVVGAPGGLGMLLAAPTIGQWGTPEQIDKWLPPLINGTEAWCQLFSEPGAGSDLAGLRCKAVRDGDEWVITGQKVWTSNGHEAQWGMLIARTDPDLPKHQGITYFGFAMDQPGVEVRALKEMTGRSVFNEVFIEEARVPHENIIGGQGNGWKVANTTLAFERSGIGGAGGAGYGSASPGSVTGHLDQPVGDFIGHRDAISSVGGVGRRVLSVLREEAAARGKLEDPVVRDGLARLHSMHRIAGMTMQRQAALRKAGKKPTGLGAGTEGNVAKVFNSEMLLLARDLVGDILGADGQLVGDDSATGGFLQELVLFSPGPPIYGGTDEIQRNVIGERGLGLPKEPGVAKETPFSEIPNSG